MALDGLGMSCPNYVVANGSQLMQGGSTGPDDCTAWATRVVIATATCGKQVPSGRTIRLKSSEPVPDPKSPGLNLVQVANVAKLYGVQLEVRISYNSVPWSEYEQRRLDGEPTILQVSYRAINASKYDASPAFYGNHAIAETTHATYDSLADGRRAGIWKWDGTVYPRTLIQAAAAELNTGTPGLVSHPRPGTVWAAFGPDVVPNLWGPDVRADVKAVDPSGRRVALAVNRTGHSYGSVVDTADLEAAMKRAHIDYGTVVDPADVRNLLAWSAKHG